MADENQECYFRDLWAGFQTEEKLAEAKEKTPEDRETQAKEGVYYFIQAGGLPHDDSNRKALLEKSIKIFNTLWKKDREDTKNIFHLAYAHMAICSAGIPLEEILDHISRAHNFLNVVIDRLPENIDARLGRIQINIQLTPQTGRPDDILLEDATVYLTGYEKLSLEDKEQRPDLEQGSMITRLAAAIVWDARNEQEKVKEQLKLIDPEPLRMYGVQGKYEELSKKYSQQ